MKLIDSFLNKITMYRLVLYCLIILVLAAFVLSFFGLMPFQPFELVISTLLLMTFCQLINQILARIFEVPANVESAYISALILSLIITPLPLSDVAGFSFLAWVAFFAMIGKYLIVHKAKHIFNPAVLGVTITAILISQSASWWVGSVYLLPAVVICGLLIVRKIQRFDLVLSFFVTSLAVVLIFSPSGASPLLLLQKIVLNSSLLFFAFIMLTEPLTTPPTRNWRIGEGVLVGLLFIPGLHFGNFYFTPEWALLVGNIYSFLVSPKSKYILTLKSREKIATDTYEFVFEPKYQPKFRPGQYLEWTLGHHNPDNRGNRRFFTIASSPTEPDVRLGIKFYEKPSSFKQALLDLPLESKLVAGQLSGDFTLPRDHKQKLVFIAGGIGVTPFRSMIQYLADQKEQRDIVLFYSNKTEAEIAYQDILSQAGVKLVNILTDSSGYLTGEKIQTEAPDYLQRTFYLSGPHSMVDAFEKTLKSMGVPARQIKIDFFPGYA